MPTEVETTKDLDAMSAEELLREARALRNQIRDANAEARDHRLERNEARKRAKELEDQMAELARERDALKAAPSDADGRIKELETELRTVRHRHVFEKVAKDTGARQSAKALDTLWGAIAWDAEGDADEAVIRERIEGVRADYDFLFDPEPAQAETPTPTATPIAPKPQPKPETPAKPAGPGGTGRGAPASDGTGVMRIRKSDLQSFDPAKNPMLVPAKKAAMEKARAEGKLQVVGDDE